MNAAFLTCSRFPELSPDCLIGAEALRKRGITVTPVIWDETPVVELKRFDRVVVRSIWDYQHKLPAFQKWLSDLVSQGVKTLNPASLMQWNLSKRYLTELNQRHAIPIIPTKWVERGRSARLEELPWQKIVLKPEISAGGERTYVFERGQSEEISTAIREIHERSAAMVQPFCDSILTAGETSLVFFSDGASHQLSHVIVKKPKDGDFRIQHERGGTYERIVPPRGLIALGERTLAALPSGWLYARVDVVSFEGTLCVGELEMMEPQLYFRWAEEAAETFADCVLQSQAC